MITSLTNAISKIIELPDTLEICLYPLAENVYGGIDVIKVNRIGLNYKLPNDSLPMILTHELIHVHQKHTGILKMKPNGECYWHGVFHTKKSPEEMSREEYLNLPWESDVRHRQNDVLRKALFILTNNT